MDKQKINQALKVRGIKQKTIAKNLGVTPQAVNAVVRGKNIFRIRLAIADAIGKSVSEVFPETGE